jgi:hypothetical protein
VQFGEAFVAAGTHGLGGGVGGVGVEGFDLGDLGPLGEVDADEFFGQVVALAFALFGGLGAGGDLSSEQGAAFGAEHVAGQAVPDDVDQRVFADGDGAGVVGVGGGVLGVAHVVGHL